MITKIPKTSDALQTYQDDIEICIEAAKKNVVPEAVMNMYEETQKRLKDSAENLPYEKSKLFLSEEVEIERMSEERLKAQLEQLFAGGYARAEQLLEKKKAGADAEKQYMLLTKLQQELARRSDVVLEAIDQNAYKEEIRAEAENELQKYVKMELSVNNLEVHKAELIQIGKGLFDEEYWNQRREKLQGLGERQTALKNEIDTLNGRLRNSL